MRAGARAGRLATLPLSAMARAIGPAMAGWQRLTGQRGMIAVFLAPNLLVFGLFILLPIGLNIAYSLTGGPAVFLPQRSYVGGQQYARLLDCADYLDPRSCREDSFWIAAWNTARFVLVQVAAMTAAALVTALILNRRMRGKGFWRAVFFFPVLLSPVVVGLIWRWILQREGLANLLMVSAGMEPVNWLTERGWAFAAAVGVSVWAHVGFYTLILLAGLQAIPPDLYEAAQMDGTRPARIFRRITLPLLMPSLLVVVTLAAIRAVQIFDEAYVLTGGGPGSATMFLTQYVYETGFASPVRNPGLAAAASMLMAATLAIVTLAGRRRSAGRAG